MLLQQTPFCATRFQNERSALRTLVEDMGHICMMLPKFHCELNWIERVWSSSKHYARTHCMYTLPGLRETVPLSLSQDLSDIPAHKADDPELPVGSITLQAT